MTHKESVLSQFEPDIALHLIEFGKHISEIEADVLLFMARKSLCLYDVLVHLGSPTTDTLIVSDRLLDMDLDRLRGKTVALIDDTLILGSSIARAKAQLERDAEAKVSTHVFCLDLKWWLKNLIEPDYVALKLTDDRVMSFCSAEVRAMSLVPRPYLVDFPLYKFLKVRTRDLPTFLSSADWTAFNISTDLQRRHDISALTLFPAQHILDEFTDMLGSSTMSCIDIFKIRAFVRKHRDVNWVQVVPIAVLKPMRDQEIDSLLQSLFKRVSLQTASPLNRLAAAANTPTSRQRLLQYALSCVLAQRFLESSIALFGSTTTALYDASEGERHFGPWLRPELTLLGNRSLEALRASTGTATRPIVSTTPIPVDTLRAAWDFLKRVRRAQPPKLHVNLTSNADNLIPTFSKIFLELYDRREIPARTELRALGTSLEQTDRSTTPNLNRLEVGLPWASLTEHICALHALPATEARPALSLVLDFCNDVGISVPITCVVDGIVFRAYRHGEDVKFSDAEVSLAYESVRGFLKGTHRDSIPRLHLEKLLVILMKVGLAMDFMEPLLLAVNGVQETLRIGFNLKGAVPVLSRGPMDRVDRDMWFSKYLLTRRVLTLTPSGQYALGNPVQGNYKTVAAPGQAFTLGQILGLLTRSSGDPERRRAPLTDKGLTLLATCATPRHTAAALQVELDIFRAWYEGEGAFRLKSINWSEPKAVEATLKQLIAGHGHEALYSAQFKFVGYKSGEVARLVDAARTYLEGRDSNIVADIWQNYWKASKNLESEGERERFGPMIDKAALLAWEAAILLGLIELTLRLRFSQLTRAKRQDTRIDATVQKLLSYHSAMTGTGLAVPNEVLPLMSDLERAVGVAALGVEQTVLDGYTAQLDRMLPSIVERVEIMSPSIEEFGRFSARREYTYLLYYDIVDSTGTRSGRQGANMEEYRPRISSLKIFINKRMNVLARDAPKRSSELFAWNGNLNSSNDAKHVFLGGTDSFQLLNESIGVLLAALEAFPGLSLRIHTVRCDFVGSSAYRYEMDTEIRGPRFWEHWSRLVKSASALEDKVAGKDSFLLVAGDALIERLVISDKARWINAQEEMLKSEIELLSFSTKVRYGTLSVR